MSSNNDKIEGALFIAIGIVFGMYLLVNLIPQISPVFDLLKKRDVEKIRRQIMHIISFFVFSSAVVHAKIVHSNVTDHAKILLVGSTVFVMLMLLLNFSRYTTAGMHCDSNVPHTFIGCLNQNRHTFLALGQVLSVIVISAFALNSFYIGFSGTGFFTVPADTVSLSTPALNTRKCPEGRQLRAVPELVLQNLYVPGTLEYLKFIEAAKNQMEKKDIDGEFVDLNSIDSWVNEVGKANFPDANVSYLVRRADGIYLIKTVVMINRSTDEVTLAVHNPQVFGPLENHNGRGEYENFTDDARQIVEEFYASNDVRKVYMCLPETCDDGMDFDYRGRCVYVPSINAFANTSNTSNSNISYNSNAGENANNANAEEEKRDCSGWQWGSTMFRRMLAQGSGFVALAEFYRDLETCETLLGVQKVDPSITNPRTYWLQWVPSSGDTQRPWEVMNFVTVGYMPVGQKNEEGTYVPVDEEDLAHPEVWLDRRRFWSLFLSERNINGYFQDIVAAEKVGDYSADLTIRFTDGSERVVRVEN